MAPTPNPARRLTVRTRTRPSTPPADLHRLFGVDAKSLAAAEALVVDCYVEEAEDVLAAYDRERDYANALAGWLLGPWRTTSRGELHANYDGLYAVVYRTMDGWGFGLTREKRPARWLDARDGYHSHTAAQIAAYCAVLDILTSRGKGDAP